MTSPENSPKIRIPPSPTPNITLTIISPSKTTTQLTPPPSSPKQQQQQQLYHFQNPAKDMSLLRTIAIKAPRAPLAAGTKCVRFSTSPYVKKEAGETVKETVEGVNKRVGEAAVKGIEKGRESFSLFFLFVRSNSSRHYVVLAFLLLGVDYTTTSFSFPFAFFSIFLSFSFLFFSFLAYQSLIIHTPQNKRPKPSNLPSASTPNKQRAPRKKWPAKPKARRKRWQGRPKGKHKRWLGRPKGRRTRWRVRRRAKRRRSRGRCEGGLFARLCAERGGGMDGMLDGRWYCIERSERYEHAKNSGDLIVRVMQCT